MQKRWRFVCGRLLKSLDFFARRNRQSRSYAGKHKIACWSCSAHRLMDDVTALNKLGAGFFHHRWRHLRPARQLSKRQLYRLAPESGIKLPHQPVPKRLRMGGEGKRQLADVKIADFGNPSAQGIHQLRMDTAALLGSRSAL